MMLHATWVVIICQVVLVNLSKVNPTTLNKVPVKDAKVIADNDIFTVADQSFRVEFPHGSPAHILQLVSTCTLRIKTCNCSLINLMLLHYR